MKSLKDPAYKVVQELEGTLNIFNPAYLSANVFLSKLDDENSRNTATPHWIGNQSATNPLQKLFETWPVAWPISLILF